MRFDGFYGNSELKKQLSAAFSGGRISHGYLLCGPEGSGKHTLARILAAAMECTGDGEHPCGVCAACRKVQSGGHPDVITVRDPEHKQIAVDIIRKHRADMFVRPNEGKRKVYILEQEMSDVSQNALLKVLEEPPEYGVFLILSNNAQSMLGTIRSRCTELKLSPPPVDEALQALRRQFPDRDEQALKAALLRGGGYLGQAQMLLKKSADCAPDAAFAEAFAGRNALAMLTLLLPMEKYKREQILPVLQQWRELLTQALGEKYAACATAGEAAVICRGRTAAELLDAAKTLQTAIDYLHANVSVGAVVGWLTTCLSS